MVGISPIIEAISRGMTLEPGVSKVAIEKLGTLTNAVAL